MRYVPVKAFDDLYWYSFNDEPIATGNPYITPRLSDPSFLLPDESPDALWHLFAHTWKGVEHYTSTSGLEWKREHIVFTGGRAPSVYKAGGVYYMLFETHSRLFRGKGEKSDSSRIMLSTSSDLALWSEPRRILDSADVPSSSWRGGPRRLFMPQLVQWEGRYRLYFGAGEASMHDTGEKCPALLMCAESYYPEGPYELRQEPLMAPDPESTYQNLAVGAVRRSAEALRQAGNKIGVAHQGALVFRKPRKEIGARINGNIHPPVLAFVARGDLAAQQIGH